MGIRVWFFQRFVDLPVRPFFPPLTRCCADNSKDTVYPMPFEPAYTSNSTANTNTQGSSSIHAYSIPNSSSSASGKSFITASQGSSSSSLSSISLLPSSSKSKHALIASSTHTTLGSELLALSSHLKQIPEEVEIYLFEMGRITSALKGLYPSGDVVPHGSFQMQTALPDA